MKVCNSIRTLDFRRFWEKTTKATERVRNLERRELRWWSSLFEELRRRVKQISPATHVLVVRHSSRKEAPGEVWEARAIWLSALERERTSGGSTERLKAREPKWMREGGSTSSEREVQGFKVLNGLLRNKIEYKDVLKMLVSIENLKPFHLNLNIYITSKNWKYLSVVGLDGYK